MAYQTENTIDKREKRMADVIALKEPDRVPFVPKLSGGLFQYGGISQYEAAIDFRNMKEPLAKFLTRYEVDTFFPPAFYPINAMEVLGTEFIRWPGQTHGLGLNTGHQIVDKVFVNEDQYDAFLADTSRYLMQNVWSQRHKKLRGLAKITFDNVYELGHFASMAAFADPEVREALLTLMFAGEEALKWQQYTAEYQTIAAEYQAPIGATGGTTIPYDMFADGLRGFVNMPVDAMTIPDKVEAVLERMEMYAMETIEFFASIGTKIFFIPLHGGIDNFMSNDMYRKFYWPGLQRMIERLVSHDITPVIFVEGSYNTRLEILAEIPKGKVIYMFENIDLVKAKKVLGGVACITGLMDTADLQFSTKEEIIDKTKRILDVCMPGGGFIMDCTIPIDIYKEELMDAWYETTLEYGKY
jgi:antitoxin component HigA of HigAB toxin-antitoxin module